MPKTTRFISIALTVLFIFSGVLVSAAPSEAECTSVSSAEISGIVLDAKGRPAVGAKIVLEDENGKLLSAVADGKGRFRIKGVLELAVYHVEARHSKLGSESSVKSFLDGDSIVIRLRQRAD